MPACSPFVLFVALCMYAALNNRGCRTVVGFFEGAVGLETTNAAILGVLAWVLLYIFTVVLQHIPCNGYIYTLQHPPAGVRVVTGLQRLLHFPTM